MDKLPTLLSEQLQKFLELFDVLKDLSKQFKGFLGFSAFFLLCIIAVIFTMFSAGSFDRIIDNLGILNADQFYNLLMIALVGSLIIVLLLIVLGYKDTQDLEKGGDPGNPLPQPDIATPLPGQGISSGVLHSRGQNGKQPGKGGEIDPRTLFPQERLFVSFAYEHHAQACRLADLLRQHHYHVWEIEQAIPTSWLDLKTEQAIRRSDLVIVLVGNAILDTLNVNAEAEFAHDLHKPLIHVLVEPPRGALTRCFKEEHSLTMYGDWESESKHIISHLARISESGLRGAQKSLLASMRLEEPTAKIVEETPVACTASQRPAPLQKTQARPASLLETAPFVTGVAVQPEQFVGRRALLDEIRWRMSGALQSVSIVANRRMGKTSLLMYLASQPALLFSPHQERVAVYINMQDARARDVRSIMRLLRRRITQATASPLPLWTEQEDGQITRLAEAFDDLADEGVGLVLLLDELEMVMAHPEMSDLLDQLRASASLSKIGIVTATAHELSDLVASGNITSPFDNIFDTLTMGLMPRAEWVTLVNQAYQRGGRQVTEQELGLFDRLTGGHPALVQIAGAVLWQARDRGWDAAAIHQEYMHHASGILKSTWARLNQEERSAVQEVLGVRAHQRAAPATWDNLIKRGVLKNAKAVFCEPFINIVREEVL